MLSDKIDAAIKDYSAEWVIKAIEVAVSQEKRSWAYADGILKRWKRDGFQADTRQNGRQKSDEGERIPAEVYK